MPFFLLLQCLLASRLTLFTLSTLLCLGSCTQCILACFLLYKKPKHSLSKQVFRFFNSCRPRLPLAEVFILHLMFSQTLFMSSSSLKNPKTANLFVMSICYSFLSSSIFSFLRLNLSLSNVATFTLQSPLSLLF